VVLQVRAALPFAPENRIYELYIQREHASSVTPSP
jgi:hypothetical protein